MALSLCGGCRKAGKKGKRIRQKSRKSRRQSGGERVVSVAPGAFIMKKKGTKVSFPPNGCACKLHCGYTTYLRLGKC